MPSAGNLQRSVGKNATIYIPAPPTFLTHDVAAHHTYEPTSILRSLWIIKHDKHVLFKRLLYVINFTFYFSYV